MQAVLGGSAVVPQGFDAAGDALAVLEGAGCDAFEIAVRMVVGAGAQGLAMLRAGPIGASVLRSLGQEGCVVQKGAHGQTVATDTVRLCTQFG